MATHVCSFTRSWNATVVSSCATPCDQAYWFIPLHLTPYIVKVVARYGSRVVNLVCWTQVRKGLGSKRSLPWLPRTGISSGTLRSAIEYGLPLPFLLWNSVDAYASAKRKTAYCVIVGLDTLHWNSLKKCLFFSMTCKVFKSRIGSLNFWNLM